MYLFDLVVNKIVFKKGLGFDLIYGLSYYVNKFNVENGIYKKEMDVEGVIYLVLVEELK